MDFTVDVTLLDERSATAQENAARAYQRAKDAAMRAQKAACAAACAVREVEARERGLFERLRGAAR